ncbi:MAG: hypothetical protein KDD27_28015 [Saprospiraceae bacterium]|nr:hypothetical protein [Saprospiraceae bacterium]
MKKFKLCPVLSWLWENFFMVNFEVNTAKIKGNKEVDSILKPDREGYDPIELLKYDMRLHTFHPNDEKLDEESFRKVENMINVLGINHVVGSRKDLLNHVLRRIYTRQITWDEAMHETRQFPTALNICRMQVEHDFDKFRTLLFGMENEV